MHQTEMSEVNQSVGNLFRKLRELYSDEEGPFVQALDLQEYRQIHFLFFLGVNKGWLPEDGVLEHVTRKVRVYRQLNNVFD